MSDIDNTVRTNAMIVALEALNLPPLPAKARIMMDQNQPHLTKLLRALADELEHPGTGAAALDALPPSARAVGVQCQRTVGTGNRLIDITRQSVDRADEQMIGRIGIGVVGKHAVDGIGRKRLVRDGVVAVGIGGDYRTDDLQPGKACGDRGVSASACLAHSRASEGSDTGSKPIAALAVLQLRWVA